MKQKDIKNLVARGVARDITTGNIDGVINNGVSVIAISYGVYGMNGGLFRDNATGELYAVTSRSGNLFRLA